MDISDRNSIILEKENAALRAEVDRLTADNKRLLDECGVMVGQYNSERVQAEADLAAAIEVLRNLLLQVECDWQGESFFNAKKDARALLARMEAKP